MKIQDHTPSERILLAEELDRRLQAFDLEANKGSSWQEVKSRIIFRWNENIAADVQIFDCYLQLGDTP